MAELVAEPGSWFGGDLGIPDDGVALAFIRPIEYGFAVFGQAAESNSWLLIVVPALGGLVSGWLYELLRTPGEGKVFSHHVEHLSQTGAAASP